jgi:hypothetical protein
MANRKLRWWARLTLRTTCAHCGELYATTVSNDTDGQYRACQYCAGWIAAGCPEEYDDDAYWAALDSLPWLLRHRPSVRLLNCSAGSYCEVAHDPQARAGAYGQLAAEYTAASRPVRFAYNAGQIIGQWWDEVRFAAGNLADSIRIAVTRPDCARCGKKATTTSQLRDDRPDRTPLCDDCCFAINDGAELPGGA